MYDQISQNKRNSWLLVIIITVFLVLMGYLIGEYWAKGYGYGGIIFAVVIAIISGLISYYGGAGMILAMSRAKRIEKKDHPQLFNVVEEMCIASGLGATVDLSPSSLGNHMFAQSATTYVLEMASGDAAQSGFPVIGEVVRSAGLTINRDGEQVVDLSVDAMAEAWRRPLAKGGIA